MRQSQSGYVLIMVVVMLFLLASIAMMLNHDSAINANTSTGELEAARADYLAEAAMQNALWRSANNSCMSDIAITATALGPDSYTASVTGAAAATKYTLNADQDAWIRSDDVTKNNGGTADQHLRFESGKVEQALTRFDLSALPQDAQINSAVAWFYVTGGGAHPEGPVTVHRVTADWTEAGATWDTMNGNFESSTLATIDAQPDGDVWVSINLTAQVQAWVNGQPNYGILMASESEGVHGQYVSREGAANEQPYVDVVVGTGPSSPVTVKAVGTLDTGVVRIRHRTASSTQQPTSTVLEPVGDVYLKQDNPTRNYGASSDLWLEDPGAGGQADNSLIKFNFGGVPRGAKVLSATLEVYSYWDISSGPGSSIGVHRVTRDWIEGTNDGSSGSGATWNESEPGTNWSSAGGDYDPTAIAILNAPPFSTGWQSWNVTALANDWSTGAHPNQGLILVAENATTLKGFRARDYSNASLRPRLTVTYACECGSACMAPQGKGNVLMPVTSTSNPTPGELFRIAMLESWGYVVDTTWEKNSQSNFDSAIAANDVVYVPATVDPANVGSKLTDAPIGVVSEHVGLNDEFGIATGGASPVGDVLEIVDSSHYITQVFPAGSLSFKTVATALASTSGSKSLDAQVLATAKGQDALVALESGGASTKGGTVSARRVLVPVGDSNISANYLTNNGHLLIQRSIVWAMKADGVSIGNLLLVVGNAGSPATSDLDRKALIESWGYAVTLFDDGDSQANFDTAAAANDVVYIAGSGSSTAVGTKLTAATIGVLSEDIGLVDELGIAQPSFLKRNSQSIDIFDNTHYVTSGFSLGTLQLYSYVPEIWTVTGLYASGLQILAGTEASGSSFPPGLALLEAGAELWGGGFAAGRRVQVPWAQGSFDINALNDDGQTIMRRAIEWGAGACTSTKPLLLVVGDAANLASKDSGWRSQLEKWCYQVSVIDDGATQAELEAAAAGNDVVYVSGTSSQVELSDKLADVATPLVNEPMWLLNDFGFSEDEGYNTTYSGFVVSDASHYITNPFGGGAITIFTENLVMGTLHGTMSSDLLDLGGFAATPILAALEYGGDRWDGTPAPARRVQVPFQSAGIGQLTTEGLVMLRRSIDWAAGADPYMGPIAHWKLDETSGTTAVDSVGGHDGTLVMDQTWTTGQIIGGLDFDGSNDYVDLTSDAGLNDIFDGGATVTGWIYPRGWGESDNGRILDKASQISGDRDGWMIGLRGATPALQFAQGFTGVRGFWRSDHGTVSLDRWTHFAVVYDASSVANDAKIYLDGVEQSPLVEITPTGTIATDAGISLRMGNYAQDTSRTFDGIIDDVRIYDRMLDDTEIAELATPPPTGPIAHWNLDETSGTTAVDSTGGHDGTLVNMVPSTDWVTGTISGGLNFDGGNDYVNVPHDDTLSLTTFSMSAWIYPTALSGWQAILVKTTTPNVSNYYFGTYGDEVGFGFYNSGWVDFATTTANLTTNQWYHVAVTFDDAIGEGEIYLDGVLLNVGTTTKSPPFNSDAVTIGRTETAGENWQGSLDDIRIYDTALSAQDIASLAGGGGGSGGGPSSCIFRDEFENQSYGNQDGNAQWAGDWQEVNDGGNPTGGDIRLEGGGNPGQSLRIQDDDRPITRAADLSGHTSATLTLEYKRVSLENGEYAAVSVYDGSTWTELAQFGNPPGSNDSNFQSYTGDISAYISPNFQIRLATPDGGMGNSDDVKFDNLQIEASGGTSCP